MSSMLTMNTTDLTEEKTAKEKLKGAALHCGLSYTSTLSSLLVSSP